MTIDIQKHNTLITEIKKTYAGFTASLNEFTQETINRIPFEGSWTAGQVTEHIIKSNTGILAKLKDSKAEPAEHNYDKNVPVIQDVFRSQDKMKSAPPLEPHEPPHQLENLLNELRELEAQQLVIAETKDLTHLVSELKFPPCPDGLTRYEWLAMMTEHMSRHEKQLVRIAQMIIR